jgi:hypothetical protein
MLPERDFLFFLDGLNLTILPSYSFCFHSPRITMTTFPRIERLPPYVFNITGELKMAARRRGEDIIDMSMGNPDPLPSTS